MRSPNLYSRTEIPKIEIRYMFLLKAKSAKQHLTNIGILTADGKYLEYEMKILQRYITPYVARRFRSLFQDFKLTRNSEVILNSDYSEDEPLYMYLRFIRQHLQFNLHVVTIEQIIRRICQYHTSIFKKKKAKDITKFLLNRLWKWLVEKDRCLWITRDYNYILEKTSAGRAREKKILRLGLYFLVVKNHRLEVNERSRIRKSIETQEEISIEKS